MHGKKDGRHILIYLVSAAGGCKVLLAGGSEHMVLAMSDRPQHYDCVLPRTLKWI